MKKEVNTTFPLSNSQANTAIGTRYAMRIREVLHKHCTSLLLILWISLFITLAFYAFSVDNLRKPHRCCGLRGRGKTVIEPFFMLRFFASVLGNVNFQYL